MSRSRSTRDFIIKHYDAIEQSDDSYVDRDGVITWFNELGQYHREDGPSLIYPTGEIDWFLNGVNYTFADWCNKLNKPDESKMLLRLQYA
jgi:hypothetical protein|tara:strand:- start:509 stop:778 length:270 start_codon:yes stop_codon:yes gene_type:complete